MTKDKKIAELKSLLREMNDQFNYVTNDGYCIFCYEPRSCTAKGTPKRCKNKECLDHRLTRAIK